MSCHVMLSDAATAEDVTKSLLITIAETLATFAYETAQAVKVRRIYFLGSFINIETVRDVMVGEIEGRNWIRPEVCEPRHTTV